MKIYSYVLRIDDGAAPNPFGGLCTLTICKPVIRRTAQIGDWIIGTGSKNVKFGSGGGDVSDLSNCIVYAMKITDIKSLSEYDVFCNNNLTDKIPNWHASDWKKRVGDCIYDFKSITKSNQPAIRKSVHDEGNRKRDLSGKNALISNHFYYSGAEAKSIPWELKEVIKKSQGHKKIENVKLIKAFEQWIEQFVRNKIYADPQMAWIFHGDFFEEVVCGCATDRVETEVGDEEETLC